MEAQATCFSSSQIMRKKIPTMTLETHLTMTIEWFQEEVLY